MNARIARSPVLLALVCGLAVIPVLAERPPAAAEDKTIFLSALDGSSKPVTDLKLEDVRLREDGADREIVSVKPSTQPLSVMLLADTTAGAEPFVQDIRKALSAFVRQVLTASPGASISLMEFGQAAVTIVPFSTSAEDLEKGINRVVAKPGAASVLLEALWQASDNLSKRPSPRRAIVSLNLEPGKEDSSEDPNRLSNALRKSLAQVWAVSLQNGQLKNPQRDLVLGQITRNSGGHREFIVAQSALEGVLSIYGAALAQQYEVTYRRPDGQRPKVVQVGTVRQGIQLHASGYAPQ
jgi:hypothetical protein